MALMSDLALGLAQVAVLGPTLAYFGLLTLYSPAIMDIVIPQTAGQELGNHNLYPLVQTEIRR